MGSKNEYHWSLRVITKKGIYSSKILDLCSLWKVENGYFAHLLVHCDFSLKIWHSSRKIRGYIACSEVSRREFVLFDVLLFSPLFGCQTLLKNPLLAIMWSLWKERSTMVFNATERVIEEVCLIL